MTVSTVSTHITTHLDPPFIAEADHMESYSVIRIRPPLTESDKSNPFLRESAPVKLFFPPGMKARVDAAAAALNTIGSAPIGTVEAM